MLVGSITFLVLFTGKQYIHLHEETGRLSFWRNRSRCPLRRVLIMRMPYAAVLHHPPSARLSGVTFGHGTPRTGTRKGKTSVSVKEGSNAEKTSSHRTMPRDPGIGTPTASLWPRPWVTEGVPHCFAIEMSRLSGRGLSRKKLRKA